MVVLACGATAFQQPRARRTLMRLAAEEPDLAELKSLFEAQPRAPRADDDDAGDDDDAVADGPPLLRAAHELRKSTRAARRAS